MTIDKMLNYEKIPEMGPMGRPILSEADRDLQYRQAKKPEMGPMGRPILSEADRDLQYVNRLR